jgi:ketosteroid isomerase-like protein
MCGSGHDRAFRIGRNRRDDGSHRSRYRITEENNEESSTDCSHQLDPFHLPSAAQQSPVEKAVLQLEQDWVNALVKADAAKLETLYADTLVYTHSSGSVDDKAKYIANLKAGGTKYLSIDRDSVKVNTYGDSAIVTCHAVIKLVGQRREPHR